MKRQDEGLVVAALPLQATLWPWFSFTLVSSFKPLNSSQFHLAFLEWKRPHVRNNVAVWIPWISSPADQFSFSSTCPRYYKSLLSVITKTHFDFNAIIGLLPSSVILSINNKLHHHRYVPCPMQSVGASEAVTRLLLIRWTLRLRRSGQEFGIC